MKKLMLIIVVLFIGFTFKSEINANTSASEFAAVRYGDFYSSLSPYGSWVEIDAGMVVWRPTIIRRSWSPYTEGHWIWTNQGWYWESYEPFGYVTYHYGRWWYDDYYGWIWVPDYEWAPAWVDWRYDDYYVGWAPLPPYATFSINVGIHFSVDFHFPYHHWHYVKYNNFCAPYVNNYFIASKNKYRIHSRTRYRNNYGYRNGRVFNNGLDVNYVRKRGNIDIRERQIRATDDPRELTRKNSRDDKYVRSFIGNRNELKRSNIDNVKVERSNRKTTLDVSRVKVGDRESLTKNRSQNTNRKEVSKDRQVKRNNTSVQRKTTEDRNIKRYEAGSKTREQILKENRQNINKQKTENRTGVSRERKTTTNRNKTFTPTKKEVNRYDRNVNKRNNTGTYNRNDLKKNSNTSNSRINSNTNKRNNNNKKYVAPKRTERKNYSNPKNTRTKDYNTSKRQENRKYTTPKTTRKKTEVRKNTNSRNDRKTSNNKRSNNNNRKRR